MFTTQMKELTEPLTVHPPREHPTREAAVSYAKQRTFERKCEIAVAVNGNIEEIYCEGELTQEMAKA